MVLATACVTGLGYDAVTMPRYEGPATERFNGKTFVSKSYEKKKASDILKWSFNRNHGPWEKRATRQVTELASLQPNSLSVTMINHSTLLIQVGGLNILTDPTWSESTGPFGRVGPSRYRKPGIPFERLPDIDAVFVSHAHYDHMDLPTLKRLREKHKPMFIVGLGNADNLGKVGIDRQHIVERDWWQPVALNDSITLTMAPAQHWSKRSVLDTNRTLWGSFVLSENDQALLFFAGDTGYSTHFNDIRSRLGDVTVALMPIGAYLPRWFMQDNHMSPAEAVKASIDLGSDVIIPMHFGTFALGDDGQDEPLVDLLAAYKPNGENTLPATAKWPKLRVLDNGQTTLIKL